MAFVITVKFRSMIILMVEGAIVVMLASHFLVEGEFPVQLLREAPRRWGGVQV